MVKCGTDRERKAIGLWVSERNILHFIIWFYAAGAYVIALVCVLIMQQLQPKSHLDIYIYIFFLLRSMCTFSALSFSIFRHSLNGCITFSAVFCVSQIEFSFCLYLHLRPSNRQNHHINRLWCDNMTKGKMKRRNVIECWTCAKILAHLSWSRVYEPQLFCKQILTIFFIACSLILILNAYSPSWTWI